MSHPALATQRAPQPQPLPSSPGIAPGRRIGRCEIFQPIARGGMATVHLGRWLGGGGFRKLVAVKSLHPQLAGDPELITMFLDEARVVARIRHPNVVPTIDLLEEGQELFIVMDYVEGLTLSQLVKMLGRRGNRVPISVVKRVMSDVLQGLHAAHEATDVEGERLEVIHRDVSPGNILVGTDGHARLLDFGVARATGRLTRTQTGIIKGKLMYLAPEQLREAPLSRRTDVYGASVVMWQALAGRRLFEGESAGDVAHQILRQVVRPPSQVVEEVDPELDDIVMRGLNRAPELRWRSAEHMAEAIEATGGLASHRMVGDWVRSVGPLELAERRAIVRAVERVPEALEEPPTSVWVEAAVLRSEEGGPCSAPESSVPPPRESAVRRRREPTGAPARPARLLRPPRPRPRRRASRWRRIFLTLAVLATVAVVAAAAAHAARQGDLSVAGCERGLRSIGLPR